MSTLTLPAAERRSTPFTTAVAHRFHGITRAVTGGEIRMGDTVCFLGEVDLEAIERVRAAARAARPTYSAFMIKALGLAMRDFPYANRRLYRPWWPFARLRLQQFEACDVSVAVEREHPGVEVATSVEIVRDADSAPLEAIMRRLQAVVTGEGAGDMNWPAYRALVTRCPVWLTRLLVQLLPLRIPAAWARWRGAAAIVSSPAKYGVDAVIGAWASPVGLSFGLVRDRAVVRDGQVVARRTVHVSLNFDRRVMAGAQAARFFRRVLDHLEAGCGELPGSVIADRPIA